MTVRMALAALLIVPAAMTYPWTSTADGWLPGIAVAGSLVLFGWWRGTFVTTSIGRRVAMLLRRKQTNGAHQSSDYTTVLLRVEPDGLPLPLIAGYLDRYGIRCDKIRITSRDLSGSRTTWIGITIGAADNLTALRARSPRIPLRDTAEVVGRRLANHLREEGWDATIVDSADTPARPDAKETWCGLHDGSGYVAAYRVASLDDVASLPSSEIWMALEITGSPADLRVDRACAIRTPGKPDPIAGAAPLNGRHRLALDALNPLSVDRLIRT
ncbi:type VII secretion protein EccE [Mycobacterium sp. OAS707]|uniref:type VII secretion protein EccE n=1 Tax=Mycobacterium sp. OAS707 TaxID=2663822 RepID=UPI00178A2AE8|nr:type VII secretion protein EccE [Mycobacterium sp. OAS707]MBE1551558.1 type VII secretion protein EccE [Mycobacterium sp. OAS707]